MKYNPAIECILIIQIDSVLIVFFARRDLHFMSASMKTKLILFLTNIHIHYNSNQCAHEGLTSSAAILMPHKRTLTLKAFPLMPSHWTNSDISWHKPLIQYSVRFWWKCNNFHSWSYCLLKVLSTKMPSIMLRTLYTKRSHAMSPKCHGQSVQIGIKRRLVLHWDRLRHPAFITHAVT